MSPPKRQHPAIGLQMICDHLAQVSLPHFEGGAPLRQPLVLIINFMDVAVGMGQHGKPISREESQGVPFRSRACV